MVLETLPPQPLMLVTEGRLIDPSGIKNLLSEGYEEQQSCDFTAVMSHDASSQSDDDNVDDHHPNDGDIGEEDEASNVVSSCSNGQDLPSAIPSRSVAATPSRPSSTCIPTQSPSNAKYDFCSILKDQSWEPFVKLSRCRQLPRPNMSRIMTAQWDRLATQPRRTQCTGAKKNRGVTFHTVNIRKYDRCMGDNPAVSYGPPISLDWQYVQQEPVTVNDFETDHRRRRSIRQFCLNHYQRCGILENWCGLSKKEIQIAQRDADKCKRERRLTVALVPYMTVEHILQSAARKTRRKFGGGSQVDTTTTRDQ